MVKHREQSLLGRIISYLMIALGALFVAISLGNLLIPNSILDGGINGVSIMLGYLTDIPISIFIVVINIPFLIFGLKKFNSEFFVRCLFAMVLMSLLLVYFESLPRITDDLLLATVFGGLLLGIGVGIIIRYGGCLDGTEIIALLISKKTSFSVGQVILSFNIFIYAMAGFLFSWDRALYSLLTYFITFKVIDMVAEGLEQAKAAVIITCQGREIAKDIYNKLGRTVTIIDGKGLLTGDTVILYSVITRIEVAQLKKIVAYDDRQAFVTFSDVTEVVGRHVKTIPRKEVI
ncbi:MAG: YitT family protein [Bacilli bacterium]